MRRRKAPLEARDAPVLALARTFIDAYGPLGDGRLVALLERHDIPGRVARASLVRLESAGHLSFGSSGWRVPPDAPALLYLPLMAAW